MASEVSGACLKPRDVTWVMKGSTESSYFTDGYRVVSTISRSTDTDTGHLTGGCVVMPSDPGSGAVCHGLAISENSPDWSNHFLFSVRKCYWRVGKTEQITSKNYQFLLMTAPQYGATYSDDLTASWYQPVESSKYKDVRRYSPGDLV